MDARMQKKKQRKGYMSSYGKVEMRGKERQADSSHWIKRCV